MKMKIKALTTEELTKIVSESTNITDALRKIGYTNPKAKHTRDAFLKRIESENIDISHFSQHNNICGEAFNRKYDLKDILIENSTYQNISALKGKIVRAGLLPYECSECGNKGEWNGKKLSLHLDHKNGINNDHRIENLRFLCPNCHSQTDTYAGKNNKKECASVAKLVNVHDLESCD